MTDEIIHPYYELKSSLLLKWK